MQSTKKAKPKTTHTLSKTKNSEKKNKNYIKITHEYIIDHE